MYTDIQIEAPSSAREGDEVHVIINVTNPVRRMDIDYIFDVGAVTEPPDGLFMGFETRLIPEGTTEYFYGSFIMHDYDVTIRAKSYFQGTLDNEAEAVVSLTEVAPAGCLPVVGAGILLVAGIIAGIIALV